MAHFAIQDCFLLQKILSYQPAELLRTYFGMNTAHHRRLRAAEFLGKMSVTEVLHSATFFADMALAMLSFYLQSSSCWR